MRTRNVRPYNPEDYRNRPPDRAAPAQKPFLARSLVPTLGCPGTGLNPDAYDNIDFYRLWGVFMVVAFKRGDVNGDRIPDNVFLTGTKNPDSPFIQNITLVIQDGRTGAITNVGMKENAGYNPTLFLGDFTGDRVDDILVGINSGGSGGFMYYYIYSDFNNVPRMIFDFNVFNEYYKYDVIYRDYYKVDVINKTAKTVFVIDISNRDRQYLSEVYDDNGKLKAPINGWVNGLSGLYPVDFDGNGVYELLGYQKIAGRYNADSLGYVLTSLKWDNQGFVPFDQMVAVFGAERR